MTDILDRLALNKWYTLFPNLDCPTLGFAGMGYTVPYDPSFPPHPSHPETEAHQRAGLTGSQAQGDDTRGPESAVPSEKIPWTKEIDSSHSSSLPEGFPSGGRPERTRSKAAKRKRPSNSSSVTNGVRGRTKRGRSEKDGVRTRSRARAEQRIQEEHRKRNAESAKGTRDRRREGMDRVWGLVPRSAYDSKTINGDGSKLEVMYPYVKNLQDALVRKYGDMVCVCRR
jgi:hypothetical protein